MCLCFISFKLLIGSESPPSPITFASKFEFEMFSDVNVGEGWGQLLIHAVRLPLMAEAKLFFKISVP